MTDRTTFVSYSRQSISRLPEDSLSIEFQQTACREYVARHVGVLVGEYSDPDTKGWKRNRPGFDAMLAAIANGAASTVIVYKLSRFARNLMMQEEVVTAIADAGGELVSVTEPHVSTSPMVRQILGAVNEQYRRDQGDWLRSTWAARARKGHHLGYAPFGYRLENGGIVPDPITGPIARDIWEWALSGAGMVDIAFRLNEAGHVTQRGKPWHPDAVHTVLHNPVYAGHVRHRGEVVATNAHPPLVSDAEYGQVQALIARRAGTRRKDYASWAEGFVHHACGRRMALVGVKVSGDHVPQFRCMLPHSARSRGRTTCGMAPQSQLAHLVEAEIVAQAVTIVDRLVSPRQVVAAMQEQAGASTRQRDRDRHRLETRLSDVKRQRDRLLSLALDEKIDGDMYRDRDDALKAEAAKIAADLEAIPAPVDPMAVTRMHARLVALSEAVRIVAERDHGALVELLTALDARYIVGGGGLVLGEELRPYVR